MYLCTLQYNDIQKQQAVVHHTHHKGDMPGSKSITHEERCKKGGDFGLGSPENRRSRRV